MQRSLKELYQLALDNFDSLCTSGICLVIGKLYLNKLISIEEHNKLAADFNKRRPNIFSKFWWRKSFIRDSWNVFWWERNKKGNEQRKKFLQYLINKL